MKTSIIALLAAAAALFAAACDDADGWACVITEADPDFSQRIGCRPDYDALSSNPVSASIPGAFSVKVVIDRADELAVYFQNSVKYPIHWNFASAHLSGDGLPVVPLLGEFNTSEYYSPDRRFLLGALNYYEGPDRWVYEIAPYDTSTAEMIEDAFVLVKKNSYVGKDLFFHPTSEAVAAEAEKLPASVPVITTDELFEGVDYQPLNLGTSLGYLRFLRAEELETEFLSFRDIVVLDAVPNDISVCMGIVTEDFQTPLSHVNVLSQNRGTPNMGLKGAFTNAELRALESKWVELTVGAFEWSIREVTAQEADEWWESHKPDEVQVPNMDLSVTDLRDTDRILDLNRYTLGQALDRAIPAFGGKASHYGAFSWMDPELVPHPKAFAIPVYYYMRFMVENGFQDEVEAMLEDEEFCGDPAVREARLEQLRDDMRAAPVDPAFEALLMEKLETDFPHTKMRFRSSTNAEDLDGFTGAGLYTSKSGDPDDPLYPVMDAVREVWSAVWFFRAFEEREYRSIDHTAVGMALLVHHSFPAEEANGVAITANVFDSLGLEPGHYVNAQIDDYSVVLPDPGVSSDQFILHYEMPGQPIVFIAHSNLIPAGDTVLTRAQTLELGAALWEINDFFKGLYGPFTPDHFYAMDVEFKFDDDWGGDSDLWIKQARPYPGWGM
jgi:hypothetical protein